MNMQNDSHTWGRSFLRRMLEGISKRMYGTKKITRALLYWSEDRWRSSGRPKMAALEMLTLWIVQSGNRFVLIRRQDVWSGHSME
jgi:hypothetical protein